MDSSDKEVKSVSQDISSSAVELSTVMLQSSHDQSAPNIETKPKPPFTQRSPSNDGKLARDRDGRFIITRKFKVDAIEHLDTIPSRWPVPKVDTAFVGNLTNQAGSSEDGKSNGLDSFLKAEVCLHVIYNLELVTNSIKTGPGLMGKGYKWEHYTRYEARSSRWPSNPPLLASVQRSSPM
jgi:hypothetical protein